MPKNKGRVLVIAGSDSGGGAGIQGDIKTITALGGYAMTAITALTAQNTKGVFGIHEVPTPFLKQQMVLVLDDIGADAVKTGMLHSAAVIECVADTLAAYPRIPLVLDPVMFAKGGAALLQSDALISLKKRLIPRCAVITPNIPEAEYLSGITIRTPEQMKKAAAMILEFGCKAVLLKGGHLKGDSVFDLLLSNKGEESWKASRIKTTSTHGTGCALASAIACGLAQGLPLAKAVARARQYVRKAIEQAPKLGTRHGPIHHAHTVKAFSG